VRRITRPTLWGGVFPNVSRRSRGAIVDLSILCALNPYLNQENAAESVRRVCPQRSGSKWTEIRRPRFPKPDVGSRFGAAGSFGGRRGNYGMRFCPPRWTEAVDGERLKLGPSFPDFSAIASRLSGAPSSAIEADNARVEPLSVESLRRALHG